MSVAKILLYYRFVPIADPEAVRLWQRDLCELLGLRGRILISKDGINGTVGGELDAVKIYRRKTLQYTPFADMDVKWSDGSGLDERGMSLDFPRLSVRVRDEIVSFGAPDELTVEAEGVRGGGTPLSPAEVNDLVDRRGDDVVFFDGRNAFEAEIGRFRNAVVPDVATTRDFVAELDSGRYDHLKQTPVVTYCTGGVRCEVLSSLMVARGFEEVYQLDGGIVRYGEAFGNSGLWDGSLYVFDGRGAVTFGPDAAVMGTCAGCGGPGDRIGDCTDGLCRSRVVVCQSCHAAGAVPCPEHAARPVAAVARRHDLSSADACALRNDPSRARVAATGDPPRSRVRTVAARDLVRIGRFSHRASARCAPAHYSSVRYSSAHRASAPHASAPHPSVHRS